MGRPTEQVESLGPNQGQPLAQFGKRSQLFLFIRGQLPFGVAIHEMLQTLIGPRRQAQGADRFDQFPRR
jgi:hypothetical protein